MGRELRTSVDNTAVMDVLDSLQDSADEIGGVPVGSLGILGSVIARWIRTPRSSCPSRISCRTARHPCTDRSRDKGCASSEQTASTPRFHLFTRAAHLKIVVQGDYVLMPTRDALEDSDLVAHLCIRGVSEAVITVQCAPRTICSRPCMSFLLMTLQA